MTLVVATDLDRTLIYSRAALALAAGARPELVCVEVYDGVESSFMTADAAADLIALSSVAAVVPVTTRTRAQLARVSLPGPAPSYAVAANGGMLLVDGVEDRRWARHVREQTSRSASLTEVLRRLGQVCRPEWTLALREADGLFCYAVLDRQAAPAGLVAEVAGWAGELGWTTSLQGRKLYCVPRLLTKSAAVAEVARRVDSRLLLAAGDSLLDIDLMLAADEAITPRHGELFDTGWTAPQTRRTDAAGVLAGQEIAGWLLARARGSVSARA